MATFIQRNVFGNPTVAAIAIGIFLPLLLCLIFLSQPKRNKMLKDLTGPRPLPFIGSLIEMTVKGYPDCHLRWMQTYGKVCKFYFGRQEVVLVNDPDMVKDILLKNHKVFMDRFGAPFITKHFYNGLVFGRGQYWSSIRSAVLPMFHSDKLQHYAAVMKEAIADLCSRLSVAAGKREAVNMMDYVQETAVDVIIQTAFGKGHEAAGGVVMDKAKISKSVKAQIEGTVLVRMSTLIALMFDTATGVAAQEFLRFVPFSLDRWFDGEVGWLQQSMVDVTKAKREEGGVEGAKSDLLANLTRARTKDTRRSLTDSEISAIVAEFMLAGSDTTANTVTFAVYLLAKHPHVRQKMEAEIDAYKAAKRGGGGGGADSAFATEGLEYTEQVVKETLRLYPAGPLLSRVALDSVAVGPQLFPKGTIVFISVYAMHRDPHSFPDPDAFRPERFDLECEEAKARHPYAFLPFGGGPRMCIGYKFAMQEAVMLLVDLYSNFTFTLDEKRSKCEKGDIETEAGVVLKPRHGVWVTPEARK